MTDSIVTFSVCKEYFTCVVGMCVDCLFLNVHLYVELSSNYFNRKNRPASAGMGKSGKTLWYQHFTGLQMEFAGLAIFSVLVPPVLGTHISEL